MLLLPESRSRNEKRGNWLLRLRKLNLKFQEQLHPGINANMSLINLYQVSTKTATVTCPVKNLELCWLTWFWLLPPYELHDISSSFLERLLGFQL